MLVVEAWSPTGSRPFEYSGEVSSFMLNKTGGQYRQLFPDALRSRNLWFMHRDFTAYMPERRGRWAGASTRGGSRSGERH